MDLGKTTLAHTANSRSEAHEVEFKDNITRVESDRQDLVTTAVTKLKQLNLKLKIRQHSSSCTIYPVHRSLASLLLAWGARAPTFNVTVSETSLLIIVIRLVKKEISGQLLILVTSKVCLDNEIPFEPEST